MLTHCVFFGGVVSSSLLFALAEVQIEGSQGWAADLPTWRVRNRVSRLFLGSKPATGYHLYMFTTLLLLCHAPYLAGTARPTLPAETRLLSFFVLFCVLEDFLWFVVNPAFGLSRFKPKEIWWHRDSWLWIAPRDYFLFVPIGLVLYGASYLL